MQAIQMSESTPKECYNFNETIISLISNQAEMGYHLENELKSLALSAEHEQRPSISSTRDVYLCVNPRAAEIATKTMRSQNYSIHSSNLPRLKFYKKFRGAEMHSYILDEEMQRENKNILCC